MNFPVLASCSNTNTDQIRHDNIVLTASQSGAKLDTLQHNKDWTQPAGTTTSLAFGGKSRYLCIGDSSGAVCLWDLKKRLRVRQFFNDGYPSRQVSLDPTDTYVITLSDQVITIYYLREGTVATTFSPPGNYSFTCYSVSALEPSTIAVGASDGSILLYDISNIRATTNPFLILEGAHSAEVTSIAMSPHNPILMASASMDGTLIFSTTAGETIHQLATLDSAITSLSLHADGISCAVSTKAGDIYLYDMRENVPLASLRVRGSASKIQFAPPPKNAPKPPAPVVSPTKIPQFFQNKQAHENTIRYKAPGDASTLTGQEQHRPVPAVESRQAETEAPPTRVVTQQPRRTSPIKVITKRSSPQKSLGLGNAPQITAHHDQSYHTYGSNQAHSDLKTSSTQESSQVSFGVQVDNIELPPRTPREPPLKKVSMRCALSSIHSLLQRHILMYYVFIPLPFILQEEIKDIVRDEVDNLRDDMEEAFRNLHMDIISQFHQQSQEINTALSNQQETILSLQQENEQLLLENERLRRELNM